VRCKPEAKAICGGFLLLPFASIHVFPFSFKSFLLARHARNTRKIRISRAFIKLFQGVIMTALHEDVALNSASQKICPCD